MRRKKNNLIEKALERCFGENAAAPPQIHEAMRYAVLGGGKRFRPTLVLSACEAAGGDPEVALLPACAVELIHCYSLVHDDLPALDNDEMRRGKPTCHRKFGEAMAILAGDALLTRAFEILSGVKPAEKAVRLVRELSLAAGTSGMIGGQVADLDSKDNVPDVPTLDYISIHKTGRLIEASAVMGALMGTSSQAKISRVRRYGEALGLAFQVVDDIMDADGYLRLIDVSQAQQKLSTLITQAKHEAGPFGKKGTGLLELADFLLERIPSTAHAAVGAKN